MKTNNNIQDENEERDFSIPFSELKEKNPFCLPYGYFENSLNDILSKIETLEDLKPLSATLLKIEKKNPFKIPENYFEKLTNKIQNKIAQKSKIISNKYSIPDKYFENLAERISEKIIEKEILNSVSGLEKKNPFLVPENYFENFINRISEKIPAKKEATIISIGIYLKKYKYSAVAIAAAVAALIALYLFYPSSTSMQKRELFVSAEDISNSLYFQEIDEATIIDEINVNSFKEVPNKNNFIEDYLIDNDIDENTIINEL